MEHNETFRYTYSAKRQEEVKAIRNKYTVPEETEDKMTRLRRLDRSVTEKAATVSLTFGIAGTLILGLGMSLVMSDLAQLLRLSDSSAMLIGVGSGVIGLILVSLAYPVYNRIVKKERARIAPEILRLTEELMQ